MKNTENAVNAWNGLNTEKEKGKVCSSQSTAHFGRGEVILTLGEDSGLVGMLKEGRAHIAFTDHEGRDNILELLDTGDCFGEFFMSPVGAEEFDVIADTDCTVMFINYHNVLYSCGTHCENHMGLLKDLLQMTAKKAQAMSAHINVLNQRTLRGKLLMYLEYRAENSPRDRYGHHGREFEIPMTLGNLAEYLGVDRSAMMRELGKMKKEGIIVSKGRRFRLLKSE